MGVMYENAHGLSRDYAKTLEYYDEAIAAIGLAEGHCAGMVESGRGRVSNPVQSTGFRCFDLRDEFSALRRSDSGGAARSGADVPEKEPFSALPLTHPDAAASAAVVPTAATWSAGGRGQGSALESEGDSG